MSENPPLIPFPRNYFEFSSEIPKKNWNSGRILISQEFYNALEPTLNEFCNDFEKFLNFPWIFQKNNIDLNEVRENSLEYRCTINNQLNQIKIQVENIDKKLISAAFNHKEGYILIIDEAEISIASSDPSGAYYALQTLRQLVSQKQKNLSKCVIIDWPAFPMRGFMHDVGRNFQTVEYLKEQLAIFAQYKINVFHWHLTDNPAWRIESKCHPKLNQAKYHTPTRNPGKYYTYDEIREMIAFCKNHFIQVIPEIDIPGHSKCFRRAMKTTMQSLRGKSILKAIFKEFCQEIPADQVPWIHIGSDEVHIWKPEKFASEMGDFVHNLGREIIMWNPGLHPPPYAILHNWTKNAIDYPQQRIIDSTHHYINNMDPEMSVLKLFFHQPCGASQGSLKGPLGSILCMWPDVKVAHEREIWRQNPVLPALLAFSETLWRGCPNYPYEYHYHLSNDDLSSLQAFQEFEDRLIFHRDELLKQYPFPYVRQSNIIWHLIGPFNHHQNPHIAFPPEMEIKKEYLVENHIYRWKELRGGSIIIRLRAEPSSIFPDFPKNEIGTCYAYGILHSNKKQQIKALIGFETPERSHRQYTGIPGNGDWDTNGGKIWINHKELVGPTWQHPKAHSHWRFPTWNMPFQEDSFSDEEFYWLRNPTRIDLEKGDNEILVKIPSAYQAQIWTFTFLIINDNHKVVNFQELDKLFWFERKDLIN